MSKCTTEVARRGMMLALAVALQATFMGHAIAQEESRLATFDKGGETSFALSIKPKAVEAATRDNDVVVYVDTSASQTGLYKRDSIATLNHMLNNLSANDRVKIIAVDLDPVELTEFVSPNSPEAKKAVKELEKRVPLGSTDVDAMLTHASKAFDNTRNNNAVYIGDGVSPDNLLESSGFDGLVTSLIKSQVSFSSLAIGPERNVHMLATLANHTGGNIFLDSDDEDAAKNAGVNLAQTIQGSVLWPTNGELDESVIDMFPRRFPPMRTDRDSIIMGTLSDRNPVDLKVIGMMNGQELEMKYSLKPEASSEDFGFLPGMIKEARNDHGLRLPTVGSAGLREFAMVRNKRALALSDLTERALAAGDLDRAEKLGQSAIAVSANPASTRSDLLSLASLYKVGDVLPSEDPVAEEPSNSEIPTIKIDPAKQEQDKPAVNDNPFGSVPQEPSNPVVPGQEQGSATPTQETPAVIATPQGEGITLIGQDDDAELRRVIQDTDNNGNLARDVSEQIEVTNQRARAKVRFEIRQAQADLKTDPDLAIERLKSALDAIDLATDLYPSTRTELRYTLESSLQSARRAKLAYDDAVALRESNLSKDNEMKELSARRMRREQLIESLVGRFNTLLEEEAYKEAVSVTNTANEIAPYEPAVAAAFEYGPMARNLDRIVKFRRIKQQATASALIETEMATLPFPGDEIMIFPPADEWIAKKKRREIFQQYRLAGSENDEFILNALEKNVNFNFDEDPMSDVIDQLREEHEINIVLTSSAKEDLLTEDELITSKLTNVRLKNALRIMLKEFNATFVVKDEVLNIISKDNEQDQEWLVTNVYNVGDLVAPRQNRGGGGLGGGLGGGGFGGGGLGGGGLGGGGLGGGGLGGGGFGGGAFCIQEQDRVEINYKPKATRPATVINLDSELKPETDWNVYFEKTFADPRDVRETARVLMKNNNPEGVCSMILGAFANGQRQYWMHESLVLAMEIAGKPKSEIERALMSAVDLSSDDNDVLLAANYMVKNGMEHRALRLLKSFARANPTRHEPYVLGLRTAKRIYSLEGMMWATEGIFAQEWPDHPEVVREAQAISKGVKSTLKQEGRIKELQAYDLRLKAAKERDCYIEVKWTGDADLDLYVVEPGGTICSRVQKRTTAGGIMLGDKFSESPDKSGATVERYVLPRGFAGDYQLVIKRAWGEVTSGKAVVSIYNHYRSPFEASMTREVKLADEGARVAFQLDRGRRTDSLMEHEIQTVAREQMISDHKVVAQQIEAGSSSDAYGDYYNGLLGANQNRNRGRNLLQGNLGRGPVGYAPQVQQLQEGAVLTATASTADRLYVIVSPTPFFSQIGDVNTFNILADADNAQGAVGGILGGGQGGGGFGGGGGGLGGGGGGFGGGGGGLGGGGGGGGFF